MEAIQTDAATGRRFALLADTHDDLVDWPKALETIRGAMGEVDAVIHCGDLCTPRAIETLSAVAPLWAVRSAGDPPASPPVLVDGPRVIEAGAVRIGVVSTLGDAPIGAETAAKLFGRPVDVCVFGGTHKAAIVAAGGALFVNPGSPTLADQRTLGLLVIDGDAASVELRTLG